MNSELNFYVFREGRRQVPGQQLICGLRESLGRAADEESWTDALLRAGELECALQDAQSAEAETVARVTDACAAKLVTGNCGQESRLLDRVPNVGASEFTVATPEGFAYYALHPLQYPDVVERLGTLASAVVIGIRSIGTTLSAVTAEALRQRGTDVKRFTVRPEGHPFDRQVHWNAIQEEFIRSGSARGATFVVVDEGPGLSGSSFLSVAEALQRAGVAGESIVLVPGHAVNPAKLGARDAERRWRFRCLPVGDHARRPDGKWIGAGEWRRPFLEEERSWPATWASLERAKFLSADGRVLWKYEGLGPYSTQSHACELGEAGYSPKVLSEQGGFVGYEFLAGRAARREDLNEVRLQHLAAYCAFRAERFHHGVSEEDRRELETMFRVNFERAFGLAIPEKESRLEVVRPAVCDAKMSPYEWLITEDRRFLKLDAASHGSDHFFPGPCDIAWDMAGAIVEWEMDAGQRGTLLREYARLSGDDPSSRIANYLRAYAVFRFAWSRMAAAAMQGTPEEARLMKEYVRYRAYLENPQNTSQG